LADAAVSTEGQCYVCGGPAAGRCDWCGNAFCLQHCDSHPGPNGLPPFRQCVHCLAAWEEFECQMLQRREERRRVLMEAGRAFWVNELRRGLWQLLVFLLFALVACAGLVAWGWARR